MEITYSSIIVFSCIVFLIGVWKFWNLAWLTPKNLEKKLKDQGFNGHPYRFLWGDFKDPVDKEASSKPMNLYDDDLPPRLMDIYCKRIKQYGKYSYVWFGPSPMVIIVEPEHIKEITAKNYQFPKAPLNPLAKLLMEGIQSIEGEEWTKHRKIISPAFHMEKVKLMVPAFCTSIMEMLTKWEEIVSSKDPSEIDVSPFLQRLTSDVISRTAFGSNYEEGKAIFELQKEQALYFIKVATSLYIPGWRFIPTKMNKRMKEISRIVNEKIHRIVESRMKAMKPGEPCGDGFLSLLLESNSKEIDQRGSKDFGLTIQEVIEECKMLYITGQETTAVLLIWTMILLGRHPEWQNRAREEVLHLFGKNQIPDHGGLNQLKIVTMILYEVLRLYPPVRGMQRITTEETKVGDITLPKGVVLLLATLLVNHDPELWGDDVKEFKPERFADGISNATKGFFPFGWGPRICLGQNFAMMEAKMAIAMILQRFSFEVSPSYSHFPHYSSLTLQPKYGAQLIFHRL